MVLFSVLRWVPCATVRCWAPGAGYLPRTSYRPPCLIVALSADKLVDNCRQLPTTRGPNTARASESRFNTEMSTEQQVEDRIRISDGLQSPAVARLAPLEHMGLGRPRGVTNHAGGAPS